MPLFLLLAIAAASSTAPTITHVQASIESSSSIAITRGYLEAGGDVDFSAPAASMPITAASPVTEKESAPAASGFMETAKAFLLKTLASI